MKSGGNVPRSEAELLALPGVGRYSANAVRCLAWHENTPMLDTNVIRLVQRVFSIKSSKARPRDDSILWDFVSSLIPDGKARELNLSMLDFASMICTPRAPLCNICPLNEICNYNIDRLARI